MLGEALHVDQLEHVPGAGGEQRADLERPVFLVRGGEKHAPLPWCCGPQQLGERSRAARLLHGDSARGDSAASQAQQDIPPVHQRQLFSHAMPPSYRSATPPGDYLTGNRAGRINKVYPAGGHGMRLGSAELAAALAGLSSAKILKINSCGLEVTRESPWGGQINVTVSRARQSRWGPALRDVVRGNCEN